MSRFSPLRKICPYGFTAPIAFKYAKPQTALHMHKISVEHRAPYMAIWYFAFRLIIALMIIFGHIKF